MSVEPLVPLAACTANSRMRSRLFDSAPKAPSAVCAMEIASLELRIATFMPRVWSFMRSAMAKPAASSLALFTRRPEDRRCIVVASDEALVARLRCAFKEAVFVLIVVMKNSFETKFPHRVADMSQQPSGLFGQWGNCVDSPAGVKCDEGGKSRVLLFFRGQKAVDPMNWRGFRVEKMD